MQDKYAFQQDAYRPFVARISQFALLVGSVCPGGVSAPRGCLPGGCLFLGGVCFWGGCLFLKDVCFLGGVSRGVCPGGCLFPGGVCSRGVSAPGGCLPTHPSLWTEFLTHASEILPCPNFVVGGRKVHSD